MFPMTHIWFSRRVLGHCNCKTVLGAIFPDIVVTGVLDYKQTHQSGWQLYDYILARHSQQIDFAKGMATHMVAPKGLDYYCDESYGNGYKGYCFQKGAIIVDEVIEACCIPENYGLWKAHNFIEMGIEMNLVREDQGLIQSLHEGLNNAACIKAISEAIETFYSLAPDSILKCYQQFSEFIPHKHISNEALAVKYDLQMQSKHDIRIDIKKAAALIEKSSALVLEDYMEFMNHCEIKVKEMLELKENE